MAGKSFVSHENKVVFWTPKCACNAVADWFFDFLVDSKPPSDSVKQKRIWLEGEGYVYNYRQARLLVKRFDYKAIYIRGIQLIDVFRLT